MSDETTGKQALWKAQKIDEELSELPLLGHITVVNMVKQACDLRLAQFQQAEKAKQDAAMEKAIAAQQEAQREARFGVDTHPPVLISKP